MNNSILIAKLESKYNISTLITSSSPRAVKSISTHCTWKPSYSDFNGSNHQKLNDNIRSYHMSVLGWKDIGQHFTVFPDGKVLKGRNLDLTPSVIAGQNTGDIGIEIIGDFDKGRDVMTADQLLSLLLLLRKLMINNNLPPESIRYHTWFNSNKTCPGTNFLGVGNSRIAFKTSLLPLAQQILKL